MYHDNPFFHMTPQKKTNAVIHSLTKLCDTNVDFFLLFPPCKPLPLTNNLTFFFIEPTSSYFLGLYLNLNTNLPIIINNSYIQRAAVIPIKTTEDRKL
mmetsp:Transcript_7887/g.11340  ORF Transcript_7887/g.11340 Transcript_7887/m.11340 type:complete len:98 (-) Transcript_7887:1981-2274(-)